MRNDWDSAKLEDVCSFSNGLWKGKKPPFLMVGVIRNTNFMKDGSLDDSDIAFLEVEQKQYEKRRLAFGDIILEKSGGGPNQPVGRVVYFDKLNGEFSFSNFTSAIRVKDKNNLDSRFVHKFLFWMYASGVTETMQSHSTGIRNLNLNTYKALQIPLPPLPEQKRIVAILDEAFEGIATATANAEKNLSNARELFESYLNAIFTKKGEGWVEVKLSDLIEISHGFAFKSEFFTSEGEYVLLTPGNFFEEGGYRDRGEKQKFYNGEIPEGYILDRGDFLIAMTEQAPGLLGSSIIVPENNKFLHNQRLGLVRPHKDIPWCNEFFFHAFNTRKFRQSVYDSASGVKVRHTSPKKLGQVVVAYPSSVAEQKHVASSLDDVLLESQRLKELYQKKLAVLAELKQSLLQKAFAGELTAKPETVIRHGAVA